ncbi:hypothetical protein [Dinghuibacter silviterrae]|uniref:Uncharacterized protein n=1 Tax=Dinghuibacter silviterrae TaxID=1539049 RepID=A0A4R8DQE9_9BACT|nr:hypothetical protein [Dinghuibacter silviterrae]TDX00364.1 hypothetical protein EDB95_1386 [Dinghuibacter silviterrae]
MYKTLLLPLLFGILGCSAQPPLVKHKIPGTSFTISIPAGYRLLQNNGPDFTVYYFAPGDTTAPFSFSGGFYFGNFPHRFGPDSGCTTRTLHRPLLGTPAEWTVYDCDSIHSLQTIIYNPHSNVFRIYETLAWTPKIAQPVVHGKPRQKP